MRAADCPNNNKDRSCPRRMFRVAVVASLFLMSCNTVADQHPGLQPRSIQARPPAAKPLYQRSNTWYEFLLRQFNPDDLDYGKWMEQHRRAFLQASIQNPYFQYSACITILLLITVLLYGGKWTDHRRVLWITAEMMTDLYSHDVYSRQLAREAIQKYNDHIERCNRAIESAECGLSMPGQNSEADQLRSQLQRVTEERDSCRRERDLAKEDLIQKERILADMSLRLDALAKKSDEHRNAGVVVDSQGSDQKLVQHINTLQERLYSERRENRRLKGA